MSENKQGAPARAQQAQRPRMELSIKLAEASATEAEEWAKRASEASLRTKAEYALRKTLKGGSYALLATTLVAQTDAPPEVADPFKAVAARIEAALLLAGTALAKFGVSEDELRKIADEVLGADGAGGAVRDAGEAMQAVGEGGGAQLTGAQPGGSNREG